MGSAELGTILVVGAIGFILLNQRQSVFIGAVKDPCAGLTGATLTACKKAQPKPKGITPAPKKGITPAKPAPKGITPAPKRGITPSTPKTPITPAGGGERVIHNPRGDTTATPRTPIADAPDHCRQIGVILNSYVKQGKPIPSYRDINKKYLGKYSEADYECGKRLAEAGVIRNTKLDTTQPYRHSSTDPLRLEQTDKPTQKITPIDKFVNDIVSWLSQAWNNMTQGKTAIGAQPVFPAGRPVIRAMVIG